MRACLLLACAWLLVSAAPAATAPRFDPAPMLESARQLLDAGQFLESVDAYNQVANLVSDPATKAFALVRAGDICGTFLEAKEQALAFYAKAMADCPGQPALENAYFNAGMLSYELGRLGAARDFFARFLADYPQSPRRQTAAYMAERIADELTAPAAAPAEPAPAVGRLFPAEPKVRILVAEDATLRLDLPAGAAQPGGADWPAGKYALAAKNGAVLAGRSPLGPRLALGPRGTFSLDGRELTGDLSILAGNGTLTAVLSLPLETYLRGVLPKEMGPGFALEALKAQAVAARSYASYLVRKSEDKAYDVKATTSSQVWGGPGSYAAKTDQAVAATYAQVLAYQDTPILAYFHSHSGGMLEDDAQVWTADLPYFAVAPDAISQEYKPQDWSARVSAEDVASALRRQGFDLHSVRGMKAAATSPSGRISELAIATDAGDITVKSNSLRLWLGPTKIKSTLSSVRKVGDGFEFSGKGYGHGVGLSQWGAQGMALKGDGYTSILSHYYPGTSIVRAY